MANVTRVDPFQISSPFGGMDTFDDMFKGFFRPVRMDGQPDIQIRMDVKENDKAYTVLADIPGVKKEDIHVSIDGNEVSISAEALQEKEVKNGEKMLRAERYYGKVSRRFALASDIDQDTAEAQYHNGVLELVLPKKSVTTSKKLTIA